MPNVLVSGASIAGPTLAFWLARSGFDVTVVERAPTPRPGGQAIDIRGPALTVIDRMGLLDQVTRLRTRLKGMTTLDVDGHELERTTERTASGGRFDSGDIEIMRDDLANLLLGASGDKVDYIYDDTITALDQDAAGVAVTFQHAPMRRFDLVIGADGLHSNVRRLVFGEEFPFLQPLGIGMAIYSAPNILDLQNWQLACRGEMSGYVIYPTPDNRELRVNVGFGMDLEEFKRGDLQAQKDLIAQRCAHMRGDIARLLTVLQDVDDFYFGPLAQVRMPAWSQGRVSLAGDAGYCPSPFSGQGTSLAIVGAFVLAKELGRAAGDHAAAFACYEARMRPFVLLNQDMVSVERRTPIPEDVFNRAKNGIVLEDLLNA